MQKEYQDRMAKRKPELEQEKIKPEEKTSWMWRDCAIYKEADH